MRERRAGANPLEAQVLIGRIVEMFLPEALEGRENAGPTDVEERPDEQDRLTWAGGDPADRAHRGETVGSGATSEASEQRFGHVVGRMRDEQRIGARGDRGVGEQRVARLARRRLHSGFRMRAGPDKRAVGNVDRRAPAGDLARFLGCVRTEAMVDGECDDLDAGRGSVFSGEAQKRE
ncbi:MAG: hypothetical protein AAFV51_09080 [Pseudomonadota bacterium]